VAGWTRWPRLALDLQHRPLGEFRGAIETGRYRWLAWERDKAIGYIDCGTVTAGVRNRQTGRVTGMGQ
jgi:hypothetical protein